VRRVPFTKSKLVQLMSAAAKEFPIQKHLNKTNSISYTWNFLKLQDYVLPLLLVKVIFVPTVFGSQRSLNFSMSSLWA